MDWATVSLAAGIATAIATVASVGLSVLWRVIDREQAEWSYYDGASHWQVEGSRGSVGAPSAVVTVANVGRGSALATRVVGLGCAARVMGEPRQVPGGQVRPNRTLIPTVTTGTSIDLRIACEPNAWDHAEVAITWTASPRLLRGRRVRRIRLSHIAPRPTLMRTTFNEGIGVTETVPFAEPAGPFGVEQDMPALPALRHARARWAARRAMLMRP